ncbi:MAG TPA: hypothetical protein VGF25_13735 [Thermoleophilaceae bacterium]|jgi:hypothetical protein
MGLLEDAIREHLDLKRKHGVPEEELDRQEAEALGPARRAMAPADRTDETGDEALEEEPVEAVGDEDELREPLEDEPAEDELGATAEGEPEPGQDDLREHELREPPAREAEIIPFDAEAHEPDLAELDEPELELAEPDEDEPDDEEDDDDVLEDTPDFLQETPEHDRLWFEQKPPRDFDFD